MLKNVSAYVIVPCKHGLHLRPATLVAKTAQSFTSKIFFVLGERTVDAKSILDLLLNVGPCPGRRVEVRADGADAAAAIQALVALFSSDELDCDEILRRPL